MPAPRSATAAKLCLLSEYGSAARPAVTAASETGPVLIREEGQQGLPQVGVPLQQFLPVGNATGRGVLGVTEQHCLHRQPVCPRPQRTTGCLQVAEQDFTQSLAVSRQIRTFIWHRASLSAAAGVREYRAFRRQGGERPGTILCRRLTPPSRTAPAARQSGMPSRRGEPAPAPAGRFQPDVSRSGSRTGSSRCSVSWVFYRDARIGSVAISVKQVVRVTNRLYPADARCEAGGATETT